MMQDLRARCEAWARNEISDHELIQMVENLFSGDNDKAWSRNSSVELQRFANSIIDGE
jgi:hypothetical protein